MLWRSVSRKKCELRPWIAWRSVGVPRNFCCTRCARTAEILRTASANAACSSTLSPSTSTVMVGADVGVGRFTIDFCGRGGGGYGFLGIGGLSFFCGGVDGLRVGDSLSFFCGGVDGFALDARTTAAACQWLPVPSL